MRVNYVAQSNNLGQTLLRPILPIRLNYRSRSIELAGLLDTGADVNVLPYFAGLQLGAIWENQPVLPPLSGNLGRHEARALYLMGSVRTLEPAQLGFAWTRDETAPLLLGQINFLQEFDICFYGAESSFEIQRKRTL